MSEASKREAPRYDPQPSILGALVRNLMSLFFVGVAVMSVYNVFGVGGEVEVMAKETACQGQPLPCTAQYTRGERTPWAHTYKMYTSSKSGEFDVSCQRQYIFVGDYSCKSKAGPMVNADPGAASSASVTAVPVWSVQPRFAPKAKIPAPNRPQAPASPAPAAPAASAVTP